MYEFANVYGFRPKLRPVTIMPAGKRNLTIPNQAIDIGKSLLRYSAPTIQEQLKGYYENEGLELPNFDILSKIERLELLNESRLKLDATRAAAKKAIEDFETAKAATPIVNSNPTPNEAGK